MLKRRGKPVRSAKDLQNRMLEAAMKAKDKRVKVGFPAGKDSTDENGVSALYKATVNNFGLGVPKRPFMAIAFAQNVDKYKKFLFKKISEDPEDIDTHLEKIGAMGKGNVQKSIIDLRSPPNAQSTIDAKGSSNPLIGKTSHMIQSVTWEVA
jgi:hypothetical protein